MREAQCAIKSLPFNSRLAPCLLICSICRPFAEGSAWISKHLCKYLSLSASFLYLVSFTGQWICAGRITDSPVWLLIKCISYAQDISYLSVMPFIPGRNCLSICLQPTGEHPAPSQGVLREERVLIAVSGAFRAHLRSAEQQLSVVFSAPCRTFCLVGPSLCCFQLPNSIHNSNLDHSPSSLSLAFCWFW